MDEDLEALGQSEEELRTTVTRRALLQKGAIGAAALAAGGVFGKTALGGDFFSGGQAASGTFVFATDALTGNFDPAIYASNGDWQVLDCLARGLVYIDYRSPKIYPALARTWSVSKDGRAYTFHLRPGLLFHDGTRVTANDCARTFNRLINPSDPSRPPGTYAIAELGGANVLSAEAIDTLTFRMTLKEPDVGFLNKMAGPNGVILSAASLDKYGAQVGTQLVGAGPFTLAASNPGQSVTMTPFSGYYGGEPFLSDVVIQVMPSPAAAASAMLAGSVTATNILSGGVAIALRKRGFETYHAKPQVDIFLGMNASTPLLRDIRVREAINYAIDRKAVLKSALFGYGELPAGLVPSPELGYAPQLESTATQDMAKAKALLKAAGARGKTVSLICETDSFWPLIGQIVDANLKELGLNVNAEYIDPATLNRRAQDVNAHELVPLRRTGRNPDPDNKFTPLLATGSGPAQYTTANVNLPTQPKLDSMMAAAQRELNDKKRAQDYVALQKYFVQNVMVYSMLAYTAQPVVSAKNVTGFNADASGTFRLYLEKTRLG